MPVRKPSIDDRLADLDNDARSYAAQKHAAHEGRLGRHKITTRRLQEQEEEAGQKVAVARNYNDMPDIASRVVSYGSTIATLGAALAATAATGGVSIFCLVASAISLTTQVISDTDGGKWLANRFNVRKKTADSLLKITQTVTGIGSCVLGKPPIGPLIQVGQTIVSTAISAGKTITNYHLDMARADFKKIKSQKEYTQDNYRFSREQFQRSAEYEKSETTLRSEVAESNQRTKKNLHQDIN